MVLPMRHHPLLKIAVPLCAALLVSCGQPAWEVHTYPMGAKVTIGRLTYNAIETQWYPAFGTGPAARAAENQFLLVRLSVANGGPEDVAVPNFTLDDGKGRQFAELSDGNQVPDWIGALRTLAPTDSMSGNAVFDVPAGHYTLHILDENGQHEACIDLPMNFQKELLEAPDVNLLKGAPAASKH